MSGHFEAPEMQSIVISCPRSLQLLTAFLDAKPGSPRLELEMLDGCQVPPPYGELLVHERDMTSTLSEYHGQKIKLSVLEQRVVNNDVVRHVVLRGMRDGRPVEYGAIRIHLDTLPGETHAQVLQGAEPLGGILNESATRYRSCPGGFLRVRPHPKIASSLELVDVPAGDWLFGRCNCLTDEQGRLFAEVVEILPPEQTETQHN